MANNSVSHSFKKTNKEYLLTHSHSALSCQNLHSDMLSLDSGNPLITAKEFFTEFPYNASFPLPIFPPTKITTSELNGLDPSLDLVRQKKKWENHKALLLKSCKHIPSKTKIALRAVAASNDDEAEIPWNVTMLAHHLKLDPDKDFTGPYNWYYSGGNMETISIAEKKYLIRPGSISDGYVYISSLEVKNRRWTPTMRDSFVVQVQPSQPVYQIDTSGSDFVVRQPRVCHYMEATEPGELSITNPFSSESVHPLVSASLNTIKPGEYCTLATDRTLTVYHVSQQRFVIEGVVAAPEQLSDNWASIHYIDAHTLFLADRLQVGIIDLRERVDKLSKAWPRGGEVCDEVCCAGQGAFSYQYVGTRHSLRGLDLRQGFQQSWTHSLPHAPTVVKVVSRNDMVDTIFLGSQRSDAVVGCENRWDEGCQPVSRSQPYSLPSPRETLHMARSQGHCLSHGLTSRFTLCLTGLCCIEDENLNVVRCSSVGDVFWQRLCSRTSENEPHGPPRDLTPAEYNTLDRWEHNSEMLLRWSDVRAQATNTSALKSQMKNSLDDDSDVVVEREKEEWKMSKQQLLKYCDMMAPKILEPWHLEEEEEWISDNDTDDSDTRPASSDDDHHISDKVNKWIEAYSNDMKRNEEYSTDIGTDGEEEGAVGYDHSKLSEGASSSHQADWSSQSKPSPTKKRKSFIPGF